MAEINTDQAKRIIDDIDTFVSGWRELAKARIDAIAEHPDAGPCAGCQEYDCGWCWVKR